MTEDIRQAVRVLARLTGMTFREAAAYYLLLRRVGLTTEQAREAVQRIGAEPDQHTRTLLYSVAKAQRQARLSPAARDRIAARIAEAAFEQGLMAAADMFGANPGGASLRRLREVHVAARAAAAEVAAERVQAELGRPPGYFYPGGPVDWTTGVPLQKGPRRDG